jgi:asparagine synthase (glutamine-hydrolysing)
MNRIAGILNLDNSPMDSAQIERMVEALKLHALDDHKVWVHAEAGLGCARIGNPSGKPRECFHSSSLHPPYLMVFDGRIDNRQELLAILKPQRSQNIQQVTDEELVLSTYEKWDLEFPKHLIGDFALAIWDTKKQRLICVRDHFGVKPFYYWQSKKSFLFASTVNALLASGQVLPLIYEERIADLLMEFGGGGLEAVDKTSTFYKDVYRLPPAHMLIVTRQGMTLERYWELCPRLDPEWRAEPDFVERFQELLSEAVRCRLQDLAVAACMLSGGMDSSAIVGTGRKILEEPGKDSLHVFAVVSNSSGTNRETPSISSVIAQGNLQPHVISESRVIPKDG